MVMNNGLIAEIQERNVESAIRTGTKVTPLPRIHLTVVIIDPDHRAIHSLLQQMPIQKGVLSDLIGGVDGCEYTRDNQ